MVNWYISIWAYFYKTFLSKEAIRKMYQFTVHWALAPLRHAREEQELKDEMTHDEKEVEEMEVFDSAALEKRRVMVSVR